MEVTAQPRAAEQGREVTCSAARLGHSWLPGLVGPRDLALPPAAGSDLLSPLSLASVARKMILELLNMAHQMVKSGKEAWKGRAWGRGCGAGRSPRGWTAAGDSQLPCLSDSTGSNRQGV